MACARLWPRPVAQPLDTALHTLGPASGAMRTRGDSQRALRREREAQIGVGAHQSIERETTIEAARVGKNPAHRSREIHRLHAPVNLRLVNHDREGALSEKGDQKRRVLLHLRFELSTGLPEFIRRHLLCTPGWPADNGGDAAAIFEQKALLLRLKEPLGETREMQHAPKAIASVRKVISSSRSARGWIDATENHVKVFGENIRFVIHQAASCQHSTELRIIIRVPGLIQRDSLDRVGGRLGPLLAARSGYTRRNRRPGPDFKSGA